MLFLIIFFWTPPHYWPLALKFRKDYEHAEVPMLPVVATPVKVAKEMIVYAVAMVVVSLALVPLASMTWIYAVLALGFGVWFVGGCVRAVPAHDRRVEAAVDAPVPRLDHVPVGRLWRDSWPIRSGPTRSRCGSG